MKKFLNVILSTVLMVAGVVAVPQATYADDEAKPATWLQLSPTAVTVTLIGGDVLENKADKCPKNVEDGCVMEVKNIGSSTFRYKVYSSPYVIKGENYELDFSEEASTTYTQISRWITILNEEGAYTKEAEFTIAPGETQKIRYRINVPEDVPGGAQYAVIWAQAINGASTGNGVQATSQAGMVISGRSIGNTQQTAEVYDYSFDRFATSGPLTAKATVKNTGNTDFDVYYTYTARTFFGKEIYTNQGSVATFPDTEYHVSIDWENPPLLGIFQVEFRVSGADTTKTESHIVIIMPIFVMVLLFLLLTVIIVWTIIIIRKRKERKARTLV